MILLTFTKAGQEDIILTENDLFEFEYEENAYSGEAFELGGVCAKSIYILIDNNTQRFSRGTFANCRIRLDIDGNFYGCYNAELPKRRNGVIELYAYDDMVKLDVEFPTDYVFPQTFWAVYAQCVFEAGIAEDISFDNVILNGVWDNGIISADYTDYIYANSCRNLTSGMAEWNGGFARINSDGKLQVDKFSKTVSREYRSGELMELDYSDDTVVFSKIKTSQKNKTYEKGDDSGYTLVINNQYISYGLGDTEFETYLSLIYDYYCGFSLTPMSFTLAEPDFQLHVGDRVKVFDEEEQVTITGNVSKIEITGNCSMKVTCGGFENISSSTNFTPTSHSQIEQSKTEAIKTGMYISAKVTNAQAVDYDSIERGLLSVDFTVEGTDSDVVFAGNQMCDVGTAGTLSCVYKVDGATQDFKPEQSLTAGKHVLPHFYAMTLDKGKHNFAVYILSPDNGRGVTDIGGLVGALSGQISGLKNNAPPNENLILYFAGVPADTEITLPQYMYYDSGVSKFVDWGDGSVVKESAARDAVSHTYTAAGNYTVTIKSDSVIFGYSGLLPAFSDSFNSYITRIYFPDGASEINWYNSTSNFPNLETLVFGKTAVKIVWNFSASSNLTSLFIPETVSNLSLYSIANTSIAALVIPQNAANGSVALSSFTALRSLEIYSTLAVNAYKSANLEKLVIGGNAVGVGSYEDCKKLTEVSLSENITKIPDYAFRNCSSLKSIYLPDSVTELGKSAFSGSGITAVYLKKGVIYGSALYQNSKVNSLTIERGVNSIPASCFSGCSELMDVSFPGDVAIGNSAFSGCGFVDISLEGIAKVSTPSDIGGYYNIGSGAFSGCKSLVSVDGFSYKWDVVERCAHYDPVYNDKGVITGYEFSHYTYEILKNGIYNSMSATKDSIFVNSGLKSAADYPDKKTDTNTEKYKYYDQTSRNPEFPEN